MFTVTSLRYGIDKPIYQIRYPSFTAVLLGEPVGGLISLVKCEKLRSALTAADESAYTCIRMQH